MFNTKKFQKFLILVFAVIMAMTLQAELLPLKRSRSITREVSPLPWRRSRLSMKQPTPVWMFSENQGAARHWHVR